MARRKPEHHREPWTAAQVNKMEQLADGNTPTGLMAHKLGRTEAAVYAKASDEKISLTPTNKSPYKRRKR